MTVVLYLLPEPGFQRKTVKGRAQVPHERPYSCFDWVFGVSMCVVVDFRQ